MAQRHSITRPFGALLGVCLLSGCISTKSYVDPKLNDMSWSAIRAPAQVHEFGLQVEFFRNGERYPRADEIARGAFERALQKSGVVALQSADAGSKLRISIDNIADIGDAMKKGIGTGLTFGGKGSTVVDAYRITIAYEHDGQTLEKSYDHALHTTVGNAEPVTDATPMTPVQAFDQVIEDAVIHFLHDAQSQQLLVLQLLAVPYRG